MARSTVDPVDPPTGRQTVRFGLGVAVPLAVVAVAYGLWWISDRLLYIGPLDRAAFGWVVVVPVWLCAPMAAGLAWRGLTPRGTVNAAIVFGVIVSGVAATLFWLAVAYPDCELGAVRAPGEWVVPSLFVGVVIGAGVTATALVAARQVHKGQLWQAALLGAGAELLLVLITVLAVTALLFGPGCQRPL